MKFYEVHYPYYALLKANDKEEARQLYIKDVADDDGSLYEEIKEVDRDYALALYGRFSKDENGKFIPIPNVIEDVKNDKSMTLLVDACLIY
ncbi:hypothetical protein AXJ14_gp072 [Geobacillus virus E3]|uniref:hypothetical protein n=1 Tax=Geobacillus virus E3 TaxID=1572712 RepID=UPI000671C90B|nr:hypothetical protein AXJ14_gp072 [Geobacillus virus E3]AJA41391.1 hypothetical protein E3_072 [Geobacillus virus E3]